MSGAEELRERLGAEVARHRDVIELVDREGVPDGNGDRFRYGCTCGHVRGIWAEREAITRLKQTWQDQLDHVAGEMARVAEDYGRECAAAAMEEHARWLVATGKADAALLTHLRLSAAALKGSEEGR